MLDESKCSFLFRQCTHYKLKRLDNLLKWQARVYALIEQEGTHGCNVVASNIFIANVYAYTLIDFSVTHLFVSQRFASKAASE